MEETDLTGNPQTLPALIEAAAGRFGDRTAVIDGDSVIERITADVPIAQSSCITCHAYASYDAQGGPNYAVLPPHPIGTVDPAQLQGYWQNDRLWSFLAIPQK